MKAKYVEPKAYMSKEMQRAFKAATTKKTEERPKKTAKKKGK